MPLGHIHRHPDGAVEYECSVCGYRYDEQTSAEECCVFECESCGATHNYAEDADTCCEPEYYSCEYCGSEYEDGEEAAVCCSHQCTNCGNRWSTHEAAVNCCEHRRREQQERRMRSEYPAEVLDLPVRYWITIPEMIGRPMRLTSVEQELSSGGHRAAALLYDLQMSAHREIRNYSADTEPGSAIVKADSSLPSDGGEAVYSRYNLAHRVHSERFSKAIWILRELKRQGLVATSRNAGTHIHIAATSPTGQIFGPAQMANLYEIFSFCEDVLMRLAAAGWASHRGTDYSILIPNDGAMGAGKLAKTAFRDRHYSLNFRRLLDAASGCQCGACISGDWAECECGTLNRGTVEWRIFNATTKPETMHGWLVLAHALTAKSFDYQLGQLQPNGWGNSPAEHQGWVLGWILQSCPLTPQEQRVILSLARRSPGMELDWQMLEDQLLPMTDESGDDDQYPV